MRDDSADSSQEKHLVRPPAPPSPTAIPAPTSPSFPVHGSATCHQSRCVFTEAQSLMETLKQLSSRFLSTNTCGLGKVSILISHIWILTQQRGSDGSSSGQNAALSSCNDVRQMKAYGQELLCAKTLPGPHMLALRRIAWLN